ncbi:alpha/beta fold hydrolase [Microbacterium ulmi]|uniref:Alpha/beta fold hydrolase n=1 Tax=Microbacterium ulmi TaxID=179095 RepID=A0A7Y2M3K8_9MICO|nr:pimeloyl-ACP methyl ester carboxylesterase [Microbacterium ulmi]NNH05419.1 alpha/beta fold hydrolase [Microbacterium ulmi]
MSSTPRRRVRRLVAVVAFAAAASLALSGCLSTLLPASHPTAPPTAAPDTGGVDDALLPFYGQTLTWEACATDGFDCTTVRTPLDWADPGRGELELSVIRHRATGGAPIGSLLTNPGGPGASGISIVRDSLQFMVGERAVQSYDVIGFDPRGVGESTAVRCFDTAGMDAYLYDVPVNPRGSEAWTQELLDAHRGFAEACEANSNGILPYITTENAARDLDLLRGVLGDTKLNYLGYSYGTFLGATYAKLYPDRVGRLVLDGAIDPTTSLLEVSTIQTIGFESALRAYMADCLTTSECPFRGTVDDALADVSTLLKSVDARPLRGSDGRMLGADTLLTAIVFAMYSPGNWTNLSAALSSALEGDPDIAFVLADAYNSRQDGVYLDNQTEAFRAYNCMDYPRGIDPAAEAAAAALIEREAPTFAPYWDGPDPCEVWPHPATGVRGPIVAAGAAPILVVGTTNDPATPYQWAVALAQQLESGILITRVGEGHTGFNKGNACVDAAVNAYLIDGTVPDGDVRCE